MSRSPVGRCPKGLGHSFRFSIANAGRHAGILLWFAQACQCLVNAESGQVESCQNHMYGNATPRRYDLSFKPIKPFFPNFDLSRRAASRQWALFEGIGAEANQ